MRDKVSFLTIPFLQLHLRIPAPEIEVTEIPSLAQLVQAVRDSRMWISILHSAIIQFAVIYARYRPSSSLLRCSWPTGWSLSQSRPGPALHRPVYRSSICEASDVCRTSNHGRPSQ